MILTKDNLLRFVQQQRYVTPSTVAQEFDTTTMIASAALSELANEKSLLITHLKLSSSPYYYDAKQPECLQELAEKHLDGNELNVYHKLKEQQIISKGALSIPEQLAIDKIKDYAKKVELEFDGKQYTFWIWYLRDYDQTKQQIQQYFSDNSSKETQKTPQPASQAQLGAQKQSQEPMASQEGSQSQPAGRQQQSEESMVSQEGSQSQAQNPVPTESQPQPARTQQQAEDPMATQPQPGFQSQAQGLVSSQDAQPQQMDSSQIGVTIEKDQYEKAIEQYLQKNYLHVESKQKGERGIYYNLKLQLNSIQIHFDSFYFEKKPQETEIISFYVSSVKPKIIFVKNAPKKLYKLAQELDNLEIVNL